jgi:hypothetical protein
MSQLALVVADDYCEEPRIYSFQEYASQQPRTISIVSERARRQLHNRSCPICNRITVEPIELNNGILGRNGRMIPGTGTLVGFSCNACGHEWPA